MVVEAIDIIFRGSPLRNSDRSRGFARRGSRFVASGTSEFQRAISAVDATAAAAAFRCAFLAQYEPGAMTGTLEELGELPEQSNSDQRSNADG